MTIGKTRYCKMLFKTNAICKALLSWDNALSIYVTRCPGKITRYLYYMNLIFHNVCIARCGSYNVNVSFKPFKMWTNKM